MAFPLKVNVPFITPPDGALQARVDHVEAAIGVDAAQQALLRVVVDERLRAFTEDREALAHRVLVVVRPLEQVVRIAVGAALAGARRV